MLSRSFVPALAAFASTTSALSGQATFYGGNTQGGMCSFSTYTLPSGVYGTALSDSNWDGSEACGGCVKVTGPNGNSITAMVTDQCPGCGTNHLDLYENAFIELADASEGVIDVTWDWTECPISSALEIHMKSGVSENWFSAQVVNANNVLLTPSPPSSKPTDTPSQRVADMQISTDGGSTWQSGLTRQDYNFFEQSSGFGSDSVAVKVESVDGDQVIVKNVPVTSDDATTGSGNF